MSFSLSTTPTALAGTLVSIECNAYAENNVSNDSSGKLYQIKADNSGNVDASAFLKISDSAQTVVGTTHADILVEVPPGETVNYIIASGWTYSSGLSVWCTSAPETSSNSPLGYAVAITLLVST